MDYDYDPVPLASKAQLTSAEGLERSSQYLETMSSRRTVRQFSDQPVPKDIIDTAIRAAGTAPSGANHQPWHFVCIRDPNIKREIRLAAEAEERAFYAGKAGDNWLQDIGPLGTDAQKPFLETAPWLIAIFSERYGLDANGSKRKNYYISESVGIATGFLISALHTAGLATLTHTPSPMKFLNTILKRPANERPFILMVVGYAAPNAKVPRAATIKKSFNEIATFA
ncbi:MAG: nitroreductase family protein [Luminiphilus sp.]|nr:nitroreductase family protein [Luminiphilus sp.]MDG1011312.1 nitroreductase family protein [Luminiphilus sp.]MDG1771676.1 nitroreductase family protein [Luminiphilus sp.]